MTKRCENLTLAVCVMFLCAISMGLCACRTTIKPGGEVVREVDIDTTIALTQLALSSAEQGLQLYLMYARESGETAAQMEAERIERNERIIKLTNILADLMKQRSIP